MLKDKKIAVFIDVDNSTLDCDNYENVMQQIRDMGEIVCGTIYGASERKHKKVIDSGINSGYIIQQPMRTRRRVRKVFDDRIFVDVATLVAHNAEVDTVAIVSAPADMVYLFSYLRRLGIQVIAADNLDEQSTALAGAIVALNVATAPKKAPAKKSAPKTTKAKATPVVEVKETPKEEPKAKEAPKKETNNSVDADRTEALLREINKLRADYETPKKSTKKEEQPDIVAETQNLREEVASLKEEPEVVAEPTPETPAEPVKEEAPKTTYVSQSDNDLIKKIEQLRKNNSADDDMVAQIKKLLDGLE